MRLFLGCFAALELVVGGCMSALVRGQRGC